MTGRDRILGRPIAAGLRVQARLGLAGLALLVAGADAVAAPWQEARGAPARSQEVQVRFRPEPGSRPQRRLARFLEDESYVVWTRDTVLARADTVVGNLLVLEGAVRIAGSVEGDVYVVDGDLFLRPGARIAGEIVALGGGFYRSSMASVVGEVTYRPNEVLQVLPEEGGYRILPVREASKPYALPGLYGFQVPTYQRVDGWTFEWKGLVRGVRVAGQPELRGSVRFKTDPDEFEGSIGTWWHPSATLRVGAEVGRATRSNDGWIRGDLANTFSFLLFGNDYRDYHRADRAAVLFDVGRRASWSGRFVIGWEEARSLVSADRKILFASDSVRTNPAVDDGEIVGFDAAVRFERRSGAGRRLLHLRLEGASRELAGDFSFLLGEAQLFGRQPVATGHVVELMAMARGDLAGRLPGQRWSAIGGIGTLPTFPILGLRGERMMLGELTYLVPIPRLEVPAVGPTELFLRAAVGSAWSEGESLETEENLMAGVRFLFLELAVALDPGRGGPDPQVYLAGRWPRTLRGF